MKRLATVAVLVLATGCESPTSPTSVTIDVGGTYRGPLTMTILDAPGRPTMKDTADMRVTVNQSGPNVTITGVITWPGEEPDTIWDRVSGTVGNDGIFRGPLGADYDDRDCGRVQYDDQRLVFYSRSLRYTLSARTDECGRFEFDAELTRN